ncbi:hypothetical protein QSE00_06335 [Arenibacter sp. M-2]|uniref:hypothetical protein n=1 Tax=Arenibacter sp. M-2 TaxID=3053612 RepID=UPI002570FA96|nr:hypothetical protein [Arenibacter sp. M-2]MDL5511421.1 hypothetical protein [Arenibacter sp. M-2]|tara:strand:- start:1016 stop:1171 length:156 start_codon:yes stop_codon:yes gene_type:complete
MDYVIYIVFAVLVVVFFVAQGFTKRKSRDRKSRKFMEDYKREDRSKSKDQG